ncbi:MAG TPA: orotate phosphoribosyltransferase [Flavobacteriaceae bacterium]|nr:orotate phosphoribosyltransferase [Flavobacteriaceae bacterium]
MILDTNTAKKTAALLLQINAIKLEPQNPFLWASGWKSPVYCDNRIVLSYPDIRNFLKENIARQIMDKYGKPDVIAGVATGAIGMGMLVADHLNLPFVYVRPEPKSHGRQNQIEGELSQGAKVVVIEDLVSTGKSSINAVAALRQAGAVIQGMWALFSYDFDEAIQNFEKNQVPLYTLSDYNFLIKQAQETHYVDQKYTSLLEEWRKNPSQWGQ